MLLSIIVNMLRAVNDGLYQAGKTDRLAGAKQTIAFTYSVITAQWLFMLHFRLLCHVRIGLSNDHIGQLEVLKHMHQVRN